MLAGEVNSPLRLSEQQQAADARERPGAACPFVFAPTLRRAGLEVFAHPGQKRIELLDSRINSLALFHRRNRFGCARPRVSHHDAALPRLVPRRLPHFDAFFRQTESAQANFFPRTLLRLQVNARDVDVIQIVDGFDLLS